MTGVTRAALLVGALAIAALVAFLPLVDGDDDGAETGGGGDAASLSQAREKADLRPCPRGERGSSPPEELTDVRALCLGDGERIHVGQALAGRTTLINVWATWCEPCRDELPVLDRYARSDGAADVLAVQVESSARDGLEMLDELDVRLPSLHDGSGRGPVRSALRTPAALPASYVVSADGEISFVANPRVFSTVEQVRKAVEQYGGAA